MNDWKTFSENTQLELVRVGGRVFRNGGRVRLRPRSKADTFEPMLNGRTATIESIEQDYENNIHLAVTVEDDPVRDFGWDRYTAHRFFFAPDEVEPL